MKTRHLFILLLAIITIVSPQPLQAYGSTVQIVSFEETPRNLVPKASKKKKRHDKKARKPALGILLVVLGLIAIVFGVMGFLAAKSSWANLNIILGIAFTLIGLIMLISGLKLLSS